MTKGAFQISREIFENPIWNDIPKFRIFFYILGQAVFSETGIQKGSVHIGRGQYLRSFRNLQRDLEYIENRKVKQYSISVISRKIDSLVKEERLKIEDTELGTLFTVVNYDLYQGLENYKSKQVGTELEQSRNSDGTELEQKRNNNKNVNNAKNVNNKYSAEFESFWKHYPRKVDKPKAYNSFKKKLKKHPLETLIEGAKRYSDYVKRIGTETQYIKHGSTFLNNDSFLDEYAEDIKQKGEINLEEFDLDD
jgi:hypothetical protein